MQVLSDLFIALLVGLIVTLVFVLFPGAGRRAPREPWTSVLFFFLVVWLGAWALGAWITPFGPTIGGSPWLVFLLVGTLIALIVAAARPARSAGSQTVVTRQGVDDAVAVTAFGVIFWLLILFLVLALVARYAAWA